MDGDDAPHAGDDSGKHGGIFAGIRVTLAAMPTKAAQRPVEAGSEPRTTIAKSGLSLELIPPDASGDDPQVTSNPVCRQKLQLDGFGELLQRPQCGHALPRP